MENATAPTDWDAKKIEIAPIPDVLHHFSTSLEDGLSNEEAVRRLQDWGPNALPEHKQSAIVKFLSFFWGPIPWMIEVAAGLSAAVGDWSDFSIIMILLIFNGIIGFWQDFKADNAIAMLKQKLALKANAKRGGQWVSVDARDLVPGDIVHVKLGNIVPADLKVIAGENLELDQSALTGESLPVEKNEGDILYMSSITRRGEMDGVVVGTGVNTYFGKTAQLVGEAETASHFKEAILKIGRFLIYLALVLITLIFVVAMVRLTNIVQTLKFCLILMVAAIPVAMPAVLSVTMAVGAEKLAKQQAVVTHLESIEELAGMDVLCSDKTGTLTQNRMELGEPVIFAEGTSPQDIILDAALASRAEDQDPLEQPILNKLEGGMESLNEWVVEAFKPFDPQSKRTEATVKGQGAAFGVSKGAPQAIYQLCGDPAAIKDELDQAVGTLGSRGFRTLGVARTSEEGDWQYIGLLSFFDPPRPDSAETIRRARALGVKVKMLTGDHKAIAIETAKVLNIGENIISAEAAFTEGKSIDVKDIEDADGFAQVFPEHKFNIVKILQDAGHFVGMTGDGVNDAPALKQANAGIAVSGATDAAREAADLVLTAPGLSVIIGAVEESRRIFRRMNSYGTYRIAETIRVLVFNTLSILIFNFYPVTALMIILLALLNDAPILMIAYDNVDLPDRPVRWDMYRVLTIASILGTLGVASSFTLFLIAKDILQVMNPTLFTDAFIQTLIFLKLTVAGHMTIYLTRSTTRNFWEKPFPSKSLFLTCEITQLFATNFAVYGGFGLMTPIGWGWAGIIWAYALSWFVFNNFVKKIGYRFFARLAKRNPD